MSRYHILYNPLAGKGACEAYIKRQKEQYPGRYLHDMTKITDYPEFFRKVNEDDTIIICGGDGTLNRFVNATKDLQLKNKIYYYGSGTWNDFLRDIGKEPGAEPTFCVSKYLRDLPSVEVNDVEYLFINAVGYGIDGYCCEVGDTLRRKTDKRVNFNAIVRRGLLHHYKPINAKVTVDGESYTYNNVWIAPTMNGRYYCGGMKAAPDQCRNHKDKTLSLVVMHKAGRLKALRVFASIFKGEHIQYKSMVDVLRGKDITVEFDRPTPLQLDGEIIPNVTKYRAMVPDRTKKKGVCHG